MVLDLEVVGAGLKRGVYNEGPSLATLWGAEIRGHPCDLGSRFCWKRLFFFAVASQRGRDGAADGSEQGPLRVPVGEADRRGGVPAEQPAEIRASRGQVSLGCGLCTNACNASSSFFFFWTTSTDRKLMTILYSIQSFKECALHIASRLTCNTGDSSEMKREEEKTRCEIVPPAVDKKFHSPFCSISVSGLSTTLSLFSWFLSKFSNLVQKKIRPAWSKFVALVVWHSSCTFSPFMKIVIPHKHEDCSAPSAK